MPIFTPYGFELILGLEIMVVPDGVIVSILVNSRVYWETFLTFLGDSLVAVTPDGNRVRRTSSNAPERKSVTGLAGREDSQMAALSNTLLISAVNWGAIAWAVGALAVLAAAPMVVPAVLSAAIEAETDAAEAGWPLVPLLGRLTATSAVTAETPAAWLARAGEGTGGGPPVTEELRVAAALGVVGQVDAAAPTREPRRAPTTVLCGAESACATTTSAVDVVVAAEGFGTEAVRPRGDVVARDGAGPESVVEAEEVPEVAPVSATATAGTATVHAPMPKATAKAPTRPT